MKRTLVFAVLAAVVSIGAFSTHVFAQGDNAQSLKDENDLLQKQVASLKTKLEAAAKEIEFLKAKIKAVVRNAPPKVEPTPTTPKVAPGDFQVPLHENCDAWRTNPRLLKLETAVRGLLDDWYPDQSISAWLGRQNRLAGYGLTWRLQLRDVQGVSWITARDQCMRFQKNLEKAKERLERYERESTEPGGPGGPGQHSAEHAAMIKAEKKNAQLSLEQMEAMLDLWKRLNNARGGTLVQLELREPQGMHHGRETTLSVRIALTGDAAIKPADIRKQRQSEIIVSGKVIRMWVDSEKNISLTVEGTITPVKKEEVRDRREEERRRRQPRDDRRPPDERRERRPRER